MLTRFFTIAGDAIYLIHTDADDLVRLTIDTCGSSLNTAIRLGNEEETFAFDDDHDQQSSAPCGSSSSHASKISFDHMISDSYYLLVEGLFDAEGSYTVNVQCDRKGVMTRARGFEVSDTLECNADYILVSSNLDIPSWFGRISGKELLTKIHIAL
jgi:hypothetical protein